MKRSEELSSRPRLARAIWVGVGVLVSLLHLFQNGPGLANRDLWIDEAGTYLVAARSFLTTLTLPTEFHSQPPLYYVVLHFLIKINSSEWFLRGFSWLTVLAMLLYILYRLEELNLISRLFFALFFLFSGFTHYLAQELRPYSLSALTTFVATILLLRLIQDPSRKRAIAYAVSAVIMLYTHAFDVWFFLCHGLYFLVLFTVEASRKGLRPALKRNLPIAAAFAATSLAYLPYLGLAIHWQGDHGDPSWGKAFTEIENPVHYATALQGFLPFAAPWSWAIYGLMLVAMVVELQRKNFAVLLLLVLLLGQIGFVHGFLAGRSFMANRYYTPAFPIFCFLAGLGVHHLTTAANRAVWPAVALLLAYMAWTMGPPFVASVQGPLPQGTWRAARTVLAAIPGKKVVLFDTGYQGQMLEYETRKDSDVVLLLNKGRGWSAGGDALYPKYIEDGIAAHEQSTKCFFYCIDRGPTSPYYGTFVPAMSRLGYKERAPMAASCPGFCR
jgi:hypothetical protein